MYHNPRLHAIKLLKQYFYKQDIDKIQKAHKLISEGKTCPIGTSVGNSPQDKFMILKILSSQQILLILEEALEGRHKHTGAVSRTPSITKKLRVKSQ